MAIPNLSSFDAWWESDGKFYDPDWSDVPWYDKRKSLAEYAWHRAVAAAPSGEWINVYAEATKLAMKAGQVTGEKSLYFVTLEQLEEIIARHAATK